MKRIRFQLTENNVSYVSVSIPYDEQVWDKILTEYVTMVSPPLQVQMAEKGTVAGMFGVNSRYRDSLD